MKKIKPYTLIQAQALVQDAIVRTRPLHRRWDLLERVYATGDVEEVLHNSVDPGGTAEALTSLFEAPLETVNLVLPHLNMVIASVGDRVPEFTVEPLQGPGVPGPETEAAAAGAEDLLRFFWRKCHGTEVLKDMVKDMVVLGPAFAKVGWSFAEMERDRAVDDVAADLMDLLEKEQGAAFAEGREPRSEDDLRDQVELTEAYTVLDEPFIEYVRPQDIFVPIDARNLYTARWVTQRVRKPVDEVRVQFGLKPDFPLAVVRNDWFQTEYSKDWQFGPDGDTSPFAYCDLYEFYDMRSRRMMVFQLNTDTPIYEGPMPYSHGLPPFVMMRNYQRNPRDFYGFGDLTNIAALQGLLNEAWTIQVENMRRAGTFLLVSDDVLTADARDALEDPQHGKIVPLSLSGRLIQDVALPLPMPALPNDLYQARDAIESFLAQGLGLSDFQRGLSGASRMSGTAASAVEGNSTLRAADKQAEVARALSAMGQQILTLSAEMLTEDVAIRVAGSSGKYVRNVSVDSLDGEWIVTVDAGSVPAVNPATKQQRAVEMAQTLVPLATANGYDPEPLMRQIFRDMGADPDTMLVKAEPAPAPELPPGPDGLGMEPLPGMPPVDGPQADMGGLGLDMQLGGGLGL